MHELTNLEIRFIIAELQRLVGSHLEQIYGLGEGRFRLKFRGQPGGDVALDIPRKLIYLTKRLEKAEEAPDDFTMQLRKLLTNAKVDVIAQYRCDRIVVIGMRKEDPLNLVIELFSKANIILCDANFTILRCLRSEEWKDRRIKPHEKYIFPHSALIELEKVDDGKIASMLTEKHIIATLARSVPIGTRYLEEALARADIGPTERGHGVETKRLKVLAGTIREMVQAPKFKLYEKSSDGQVEFTAFDLSDYANMKATSFPSLSECIDAAVAKAPSDVGVDTTLIREREKLERAIEEQKVALAGYEKEEREAKEKGDAMYAHYETVARSLEEAKKEKKARVEVEV